MREGIRVSQWGLGNISHYFSQAEGPDLDLLLASVPTFQEHSPRARGISKEFSLDPGNVQHEQSWS